MIRVVAALIQQQGRLLICQRRKDDLFPLKWEFPGGKVQEGETPAGALRRELREELGIEAQVGREVYRTRHRYPEYTEELELTFFSVRMDPPAQARRGGQAGAKEFENLPARLGGQAGHAFEQVCWVEPGSLPGFDFLPADAELIRKLSTGALRLP